MIQKQTLNSIKERPYYLKRNIAQERNVEQSWTASNPLVLARTLPRPVPPQPRPPTTVLADQVWAHWCNWGITCLWAAAVNGNSRAHWPGAQSQPPGRANNSRPVVSRPGFATRKISPTRNGHQAAHTSRRDGGPITLKKGRASRPGEYSLEWSMAVSVPESSPGPLRTRRARQHQLRHPSSREPVQIAAPNGTGTVQGGGPYSTLGQDGRRLPGPPTWLSNEWVGGWTAARHEVNRKPESQSTTLKMWK